MPLGSTSITVSVVGGLATVLTERRFENHADVPIEAIMTFPVGFDAIVTGLVVKVDDRIMKATAQPKFQARETYEDAIDRGKLAVLHEEVLRGVHMVSVAQLARGKSMSVEVECVIPLALMDGQALLRIPQTVGQLYGTSPLQPADDLVVGAGTSRRTAFTVRHAHGPLFLQNVGPIAVDQSISVSSAAAIELQTTLDTFGKVAGTAADGKVVTLELRPVLNGDKSLDLAILVDRSGSTASGVGSRGESVWSAMRNGLEYSLRRLEQRDRIVLWQFDDKCDVLGAASGADSARLPARLKKPGGGTELGNAIQKVVEFGARDVLVLTDGQTWAHIVDELASTQCRISAILVGADSLDANIGHLVAMTGGQLFYAPGDDVASALGAALAVARSSGKVSAGDAKDGYPRRLTCVRGGIEISAIWGEVTENLESDPAGRFAAALALPLMRPDEATTLAVAHRLCTHATSLVMVDEDGDSSRLLPEMRKIGLAQAAMPMMSAPMMPQVSESSPRFRLRRQTLAEAGFHEHISMDLERRLASPRTDPGNVLIDLAERIDWATTVNAFLQGDLSSLGPNDRRALGRMCGKIAFIEVAADLGIRVELVGLAMVAAEVSDEDQAAARYVRRILGPN